MELSKMAVETINRENELALWLMVSSPRPVTNEWIMDHYQIDMATLHQDLAVIKDFATTFRLTLNPEFDQLSIYGHENDIQQAMLFILMDLHGQASDKKNYLPQEPFGTQRLTNVINNGIDNLAAFTDLSDASKTDLANYLWTLTLRYHFGVVKHAHFQQLFTHKQAHTIEAYDQLFKWSERMLNDLSQLYRDFDFPELETYLLTLRVWLNK